MTERQTYPSTEIPDHPHAATVTRQLKLIEVMLDHWFWEIFPDGELTVLTRLRTYDRTLRIWLKEDTINIDVACGYVPFNAHMLTWILAENLGQKFTARATEPENNLVPIYLTADYPLDSLEQLSQLVWAGYQASLTWWGRIIRVEIPEEKPAINA